MTSEILPIKVEKPWGYELIWAKTDKYVSKILHINKGESLSLQYHNVKDESIRVLRGALLLELEMGGKMVTLEMKEGMSQRIMPGSKHRMSTTTEGADLIEVSTPELEDVVRLEDRYGRA